MPSIVLLICGTRRSGKDTLARHLGGLTDYRCSSYSFADQLRADLRPFIVEHFDVDIMDCTPEQKEIVRPLLIAHGCAKRAVNPNHWVDVVLNDIRADAQVVHNAGMIPVITDGRFVNEVTRLREEFGAALRVVNVTRVGAPAPTDEEEKHYRQVAALADFQLHWGCENEKEQIERAREVLEWLEVPVAAKA